MTDRRDVMSEERETAATERKQAEGSRRPGRRPWSTPRVIESDVSTETLLADVVGDDGPFFIS
ncbi:MAG: hypothetical protein ACRED5_21120 [Propylenella sp.]